MRGFDIQPKAKFTVGFGNAFGIQQEAHDLIIPRPGHGPGDGPFSPMIAGQMDRPFFIDKLLFALGPRVHGPHFETIGAVLPLAVENPHSNPNRLAHNSLPGVVLGQTFFAQDVEFGKEFIGRGNQEHPGRG